VDWVLLILRNKTKPYLPRIYTSSLIRRICLGKAYLEKYYRSGKLPSHIRKGSFWWRDTLKLLPDLKTIARPHVRSGESSVF
jgi:hypothetical protein